MAAFEQMPLVGFGSELQLTLDGRAVPYLLVVQAGAAVTGEDAPEARVDPAPDRQITFALPEPA